MMPEERGMVMGVNERMRCHQLRNRTMSGAEAAELIQPDMVVGTSGFTPSGYPKEVPAALAERISQNPGFQITLYTGASVGWDLDGALSSLDGIFRRMPYQTNGEIRERINSGQVRYQDVHLSHFPQEIRYGFFPRPNVAIVEAAAILEDGSLVPTTSVGASPTFCQMADQVIVEINNRKPVELEGFHDIYQPLDPPHRQPIPLLKPDQRIGEPVIRVPVEKIKAVVFSDKEDDPIGFAPVDETSRQIASHLIHFLEEEVQTGRLPEQLFPLQSGVGSVANAVLKGMEHSRFSNLVFYSEVIQDNVLDLLDQGTFRFASGTSLTLSPEGFRRFYQSLDKYREKVLLRPMEVSNNPEIIRRLGSIAMNTAIEADLYGNVNSTHLMGHRMMNGIGGSGDFTRAGSLSIFTTPSTAKNGTISAIVPMVSHVDHTEHDVKIMITEQGFADLRGISPVERGERIIECCAHPDFRPALRDYLAEAKSRGGHTPHCLEKALSWHHCWMQTGSMRNR